jgi:hypothetical protein
MDTTNARDALYGHIKQFPDLFTPELIGKVFANCFSLAVENDWF